MKKITLLVLITFSFLGTQKIFSQDNPFVGEIRMFAGNFAPNGWAKCEGQLLPISQNTALFSLLGTFYGGNGSTTFALPDLRGRAPIHQGQGPGLSEHYLGEMSGSNTVTLDITQLPAHNHTVNAVSANGNQNEPSYYNLPANTLSTDKEYSDATTNITRMNATMISVAGGSQPMNNIQPYITVTYIIALQGVFPPRS
jgi:microcystin-dependent protein